jgi:hypothetical protein
LSFIGCPPDAGTAWVLGWIPFAFSSVLFALPMFRAMTRGKKEREIAQENGRRGLLFAVLSRANRGGFREDFLANTWKLASGAEPSEKELTREIVRLGGEAEIQENGELLYRFRDLEAELEAAKVERSLAKDEEKDAGAVAFSSDR